MPSNRRRIKKNARSLQRREPRALGMPLVPAHERTNSASRGIEGLESEIAGSEIKLFVVKRIVGNMHLPIDAALDTIGVEEDGSVVVKAGRAFLEERGNQHNFALTGC